MTTGIFYKSLLALAIVCIVFTKPCIANQKLTTTGDSLFTSTADQAITFINKIDRLDSSFFWPGIKPALFLKNLKEIVNKPLSSYAGSSTNFCGYGALTYLFLQDDPLGFAKLLLQLYNSGNATYRSNFFTPSAPIYKAAGRLRFKGKLDISPAEQMWYLCLADHFKGYLNIFDHHYKMGDENRLWASVNFGKFNRMTKKLLHYNLLSRGADIKRPYISNLYEYIHKKLENGTVILYINNRIVHKKNHMKIKLGFPTHFVVVEKISKVNNLITLVYWDYGSKTLLEIAPTFLRRIVFGISYFTKKTTDAE